MKRSSVRLSVRPSVRLSRRSTAEAACGGFAADRRQEISIDGRRRCSAATAPQLGAQQQMQAVSF